jgi:hypothetical protein
MNRRLDVVGAHEARPYQVRVAAGLVPALGVAPVSDRRPASRRLALGAAIACGALLEIRGFHPVNPV